MDVFEALETRRSIRQYTTNEPIPNDHFDALIQAARFTPSSFNIQHTRIVRLTDLEKRAALQDAAWGQEQITQAQEVLVLCADVQAWNKQPERYWRNLASDKQTYIVNLLTDFYADKPELQRDEAIRSAALTAQSLMLACKSLGYDSNPMVGFDAHAVGQLVNLPDDYIVCMIICIGQANEQPGPRGGEIPLQHLLVHNHF